MKVKELIEKLQQFDGELEVGGSGHFGELLEIYDVRPPFDPPIGINNFVEISIQWAGDSPD